MKAELIDGSIVDLPRDCHCLIHDGPHWLHMNDLARQMNLDLIGGSTSPLTVQRFAELEMERLSERRRHMEQSGIVRIIREDTSHE